MAIKKITKIEDLAVMVQKEFSGIHEHLNKHDKEFLWLREEVASIKMELESIKLRMGEMAFRFEVTDLERRLKRVESRLGMK